jgi:uncharacterized repeat protein (TIGR03847 family)
VRELGPAEQFRMDAVGPSGERTFFLFVEAGGERHWFLAEKQQVAALAELGERMLVAAEVEFDGDAVLHIQGRLAELAVLGKPTFRVGDLRLGLRENEMVSIILESTDEDDESTNFIIAPEQLQAASTHAMKVVASGRPLCPRCAEAIDPGEYHQCSEVDPNLN